MIGSIEATSTPIVSQSISRQPSHLYRSRLSTNGHPAMRTNEALMSLFEGAADLSHQAPALASAIQRYASRLNC